MWYKEFEGLVEGHFYVKKPLSLLPVAVWVCWLDARFGRVRGKASCSCGQILLEERLAAVDSHL